jgi:uncharacterized protein YcnI
MPASVPCPVVVRRGAAITAATVAAVLLPAAVAAAHVTVVPSTTVGGSDEISLAFRVPAEEPTASTTSIAITLPLTQPFADVQARPIPGWSVTITDAKLATPVVDDAGTTLTRGPHIVTWRATSAASAIPPGEYQEFDIYAGPLPESGTETFAAVQTYSDGSVVRWDQVAAAGAAEPAHPAPSFTITAANAVADGVDHTARLIAITGVAVGVLGLIVGAAAFAGAGRRPRRRTPAKAERQP